MITLYFEYDLNSCKSYIANCTETEDRNCDLSLCRFILHSHTDRDLQKRIYYKILEFVKAKKVKTIFVADQVQDLVSKILHQFNDDSFKILTSTDILTTYPEITSSFILSEIEQEICEKSDVLVSQPLSHWTDTVIINRLQGNKTLNFSVLDIIADDSLVEAMQNSKGLPPLYLLPKCTSEEYSVTYINKVTCKNNQDSLASNFLQIHKLLSIV